MTNKTIQNLTKYLQIKKDKEEISFLEVKIKKDIEKSCENIKTFLKNAKPFIEGYCELYKNYCHINQNNYISYNNSLKTKSFNCRNYKDIYKECIESIISISKNIKEDEEDIQKLSESYNTLVLILSVKDNLINDAIKVEFKDINRRIEEKQIELNNETDNLLLELIKAIENKDKKKVKNLITEGNNSVYCEGNIIYGTKPSTISNELREFLEEYDVSLEEAAERVYLEAKNGKNAVYVRINDMDETSTLMEDFLPNLFTGLVSSYAPNSFYLAFLETVNITNMVCAKFCNRIINTQNSSENSGLIDSCLYKVSSSRSDFSYTNINGIATQEDEIKKLISSLYNEFNRRKTMPQLSNKTIVSFNEDNPYEILPYITLIINTFSNLFDYHEAKEIYEKLKTLVQYGGNYGIFIICVGKDTVIKNDKENIISEKFDLSLEFNNIIEYKDNKINILRSDTNEKEVLEKWETKCKEFSSIMLEVLVERKDIKILDFNNPKGIITIPIGISNGKVNYFKTAIQGDPNSDVSTIITGKIGSGKTTFIRTLIMSGGYFYSPDQLQFYIIDFKTKEGTADFNCFCQGENGYIPHIRFLAARSGVEQILSLLDFIDKITIERSGLFTKYSKYDVKDAVTYRQLLYKKMKEEGCTTYPEYYQKKQKEAMASLPQIYLLVDEANMVFKDDNIDLFEKLENIAGKIRSYGISLIICGQYNPFGNKKVLLGHFGNRIALAAKEYSLFKNTFAGETPEKDMESSFSFLGGQQGKAAFQLGNQKNLTNISTAYIKNEALKDFASRINEKYSAEAYKNWIQNRPGTKSIASADELVLLLEDQNSIINLDENKNNNNSVIRLYVGKNSLSSYPYPIVLKEIIKGSNKEQSNTDPRNYCIYSNLITQLKVLWNMTLYLAYCQKKEKLDIPDLNLSVNYACITERDAYGRVTENIGEKLMTEYEELVNKSCLDDCIKVNKNTNDILKEFQKCYKIFQERSKKKNQSNQFPYLFCLANANEWISLVEENNQENFEEETPIIDNQEFIDYFTDYCNKKGLCSKEEIEIYQNEGMKALNEFIYYVINYDGDEEIKERYYSIVGNNKKKKISSDNIIEQLREMLEKGALFAVYVVVGYSSANENIKNNRFIDIEKWKNMIKDSETNENICYCKGVEIQLYDYLKSERWIEFITKIINE